ncbi:HDOD domain-containing protein [Aquisalimonas asiatica]|uniref:HD-like signal output (HDOD) domain, no enzymatic activity n=1 Tax=Aquisalimonas asiatica TaxID=406100 RepID=A0A1H8VM80_9GAMM|nr:HDOD domain-containing protein [Aquisalimonas asiatica]SEP16404.1 HD-like signal output (HDOD) domain, no enzymatic activity [Aquisalimonas asiatica]
MAQQDLERIEELPTLPRFVQDILKVVNDKDAPLPDVAAALAMDPGTSGRVVSAANAAFFTGYQPIYSVDDAAVRLGLNRVRVLATTTLLSAQFQSCSCPALNQGRFWRASMNVALCASKLGNYVPLETETAAGYLAGLLHNIGVLANAHVFPDAMQRALTADDRDDTRLAEREQRELGFDHYQSGSRLLASWDLPDPLVTVVAHHADPDYQGDWARLTDMVGACVDWYRAGYEDRPTRRILRGISEPKLNNIGMSCRREDEQLGTFAEEVAGAA